MFIPLGDDVEKRNLPIVTSALILINILIFAYQSRLFHEGGNHADVVAETFFSKWALIPSDLADGQVMGLLSHMFLHGDVMHILGNNLSSLHPRARFVAVSPVTLLPSEDSICQSAVATQSIGRAIAGR